MSEELRVCRKCHFEKSVSDFTVVDKRTGRRKLACRACEALRIKAYYDSNPEYRETMKARSRAWAKANPIRNAVHARTGNLRRQYGLSKQQFADLLATQEGKCALCRTKEHGRSTVEAGHWMVDHSHDTGEVRGLLCNGCNIGLGHYEKLMREVGEGAVLDYLTRPSPVPKPAAVESFVPRYVADIPGQVAPHCSVDGCERDAKWSDLCHTHHMNRFRARVLESSGNGIAVHQRGATQWKARLTDDDVRTIRASAKKGVDLAMEYDVSTGCISQIKRRQTWKHVE